MLISRDMHQLLCDMSDCSCIDYDWLQWYVSLVLVMTSKASSALRRVHWILISSVLSYCITELLKQLHFRFVLYEILFLECAVPGKCTFYNPDFKPNREISQKNTSGDGIIKSSSGEQQKCFMGYFEQLILWSDSDL